MNILGLVFSLLLILSYGYYACWDKLSAFHRISSTYVGNQKANRKILKSYQSEIYSGCHAVKYDKEREKEETCRPPKSKIPPPQKPELNHECSKFNLWPLIQEGKAAHPVLYNCLIQMIQLFYAPLYEGEKQFEHRFLDRLVKAASLQKESSFALEKLQLDDPVMQKIYYKMLKGTKQWDIHAKRGYPTLLDYIKIEHSKELVCLFHAHPDVFAVLFGHLVAEKVYGEIHKKDGPVLTKELIEKAASETRTTLNNDFFSLVQWGRSEHEEFEKTFVAEDPKTHVVLRKTISLKN